MHAGGARRVLESSSVSYIYDYSKKYYVQCTAKTIVVPLVLSVIDTNMMCRLINVRYVVIRDHSGCAAIVLAVVVVVVGW